MSKSNSVPVQSYISEDMRDKFRAAYTTEGFPSDSSAIAQLVREYIQRIENRFAAKAQS